MAGLGEDVGVWRGVRWKVAGCSGCRWPEVVAKGGGEGGGGEERGLSRITSCVHMYH